MPPSGSESRNKYIEMGNGYRMPREVGTRHRIIWIYRRTAPPRLVEQLQRLVEDRSYFGKMARLWDE